MLLTKVCVPAAWAIGCLVLGGSGVRAAQEPTPKFTNVEVLSVNVQQRLLVVRTNDGAEQTLELDAKVAGFADLRTGDRVILTLRGEPGRARVEAVSRSVEAVSKSTAAAEGAPPSESTAVADVPGDERVVAEAEYSRRVADLARQADEIDRIWSGFRGTCGVSIGESSYESSREWLSLWDAVPVDLSSGHCRELFNQIVGRGQSVNAGMAAAETDARRSLQPGRIREIQARYSLDWSSWGRTPPKRLEQ
jgi:hypothetical protein